MPWDPSSGQSFGAYMRDGAPLGQGRTVDVITDEPTWVTRDQVVEGRTEEGSRFKQVTDQLGHQVTEETTASGRQRKHVRINL